MSVGIAKFCFKGMEMRHEKSTIVSSDPNELVVEQHSDKTPLKFVNVDGRWLLEGHTNKQSLLYGSEFIFKQ
jgi:hypothetical protein